MTPKNIRQLVKGLDIIRQKVIKTPYELSRDDQLLCQLFLVNPTIIFGKGNCIPLLPTKLPVIIFGICIHY